MKMATTTSAMLRHAACVLLALLLGGCRADRPSPAVPVVDFIKTFDRAEKRPPDSYTIADHLAAGTRRPAIMAPAPGRITWTLPLPRRGMFRAAVAATTSAPVRVRLGVSDTRIYEALADVTVTESSGWSMLTADLSAYAGWKFSVFYQPERRSWNVNVSLDAIGGVPTRIALGAPEIVTDRAGAAEYTKRRPRLTRSEAP
jgi:hypothetical protein